MGKKGKYDEDDDAGRIERLKGRLEINNTLILSIATLSITWCSYQSTLWDGIQTFKLADANVKGRMAQEKILLAVQHQAMDQGLIVNFMQDVWNNNKERVRFTMQRIRPELGRVMKHWLAMDPLHNPAAPPHPMALDEYKKMMNDDLNEYQKLNDEAGKFYIEADKANSNADHYSLFTVIFSMIMFLGAITTKMTHLRLSFTLIAVSGLICIIILALLFLYMPLATS